MYLLRSFLLEEAHNFPTLRSIMVIMHRNPSNMDPDSVTERTQLQELGQQRRIRINKLHSDWEKTDR